jgi:hypothetical protein
MNRAVARRGLPMGQRGPRAPVAGVTPVTRFMIAATLHPYAGAFFTSSRCPGPGVQAGKLSSRTADAGAPPGRSCSPRHLTGAGQPGRARRNRWPARRLHGRAGHPTGPAMARPPRISGPHQPPGPPACPATSAAYLAASISPAITNSPAPRKGPAFREPAGYFLASPKQVVPSICRGDHRLASDILGEPAVAQGLGGRRLRPMEVQVGVSVLVAVAVMSLPSAGR